MKRSLLVWSRRAGKYAPGAYGLLCVVLAASPAWGDLLFTASLRNGDYGTGQTQDTMDPAHGGSPHVLGIVDSAEGVTFTPTETDGRGNAVIYWQPGTKRESFRQQGTISMWIYVDHDVFPTMDTWGHIWCENYGWGGYRNGMASFSAATQHVAHDVGVEDDRVRLTVSAIHNDVWYFPDVATEIEYDRWHNVGYTWNGPDYDYEIWVNGQRAGGGDLPAGVSFPWGVNWAPSGTNWGLGGLHERGHGLYGSNSGVTYRDLEVWDEYVPNGNTVPEPGPLTMMVTLLVGLGGFQFFRRLRKPSS